MVKKNLKVTYYEAIGRRKSSVSRVRLYLVEKGKQAQIASEKLSAGQMSVNGKPIQELFPSKSDKVKYLKPLELTGNQDRFAISVKVYGGGKSGQLEAITHGLARALEKVDSNTYKKLLKEHMLLTRDPRSKERRKVGTGGKARRKKQSPKR